MTRETAREFIPLLQAYADGKEIQMLNPSCTWRAVDWELHFGGKPSDYRIKPEPKLRPWRPEEVPVGAIVKSDVAAYLIIAVNFEKAAIAMMSNTMDVVRWYATDSIDGNHYSTDGGKTWKPCGVEE